MRSKSPEAGDRRGLARGDEPGAGGRVLGRGRGAGPARGTPLGGGKEQLKNKIKTKRGKEKAKCGPKKAGWGMRRGEGGKPGGFCQMRNAPKTRKASQKSSPPPTAKRGKNAQGAPAWLRPGVPVSPHPQVTARGDPAAGGSDPGRAPPSPGQPRGATSPAPGRPSGAVWPAPTYRLPEHFPYESSETFLILS